MKHCQRKISWTYFNNCSVKGCNNEYLSHLCCSAYSCVCALALVEGMHVHKQLVQSGCGSDIFMGSSKLVDMHAICGSIEDVLEMFSKMSIHSVVSWTAMLQDMSCVGLVGKLLDI